MNNEQFHKALEEELTARGARIYRHQITADTTDLEVRGSWVWVVDTPDEKTGRRVDTFKTLGEAVWNIGDYLNQ